jgi:aspartate aminotransferase/aminotransferase
MFPDQWLADRCGAVEVSGVRKIFELGKALKNPINLSIGQPHFDVPEPIKAAAKHAIDTGHNGYTVTQGIPELLNPLRADVAARFPGQERDVLATSGTSGGLLLALLATVNPGDEVLTADPYFVAYPNMVALAGGTLKTVDTYPDFRLDLNRLADAFTPRTKAVLLSTPSNPTGAVIDAGTQKELADLCRAKNALLISDEIYRAFHYSDELVVPSGNRPTAHKTEASGPSAGPLGTTNSCADAAHASPASYDPNVLVVEGFGKTYGMTGWRLGWAHGPKRLIQEMAKIQQCTFVCAPSMVQHAGAAAVSYDVSGIVADYKRKRDFLMAGLKDDYEFAVPGGAFYLFPKSPRGTGTEFVTEAVTKNLLVIPGGVFSRRDTHFRVSYAASDDTLARGIEVLKALARG